MKKPKPTKTPETQTARRTAALHCAAKPFFQVATSNRSAQEVEMLFPKRDCRFQWKCETRWQAEGESTNRTARRSQHGIVFIYSDYRSTVRYHCCMKDSAALSATPSQWLRLYTSAPYGCSYLATEKARMQVLDPQATADTTIYAKLIEQGFRRSGLSIYRPACAHCQRCLPLRVPVDRFTPNRSQRRAIQQHAALQVRLLPLVFQPEHYALYQQYQQQRHADCVADNAPENGEQEYRDFILASPVDSFLAEFRTSTELLKIVALIDRLPHALSAVYTFYANDPGASYGTYAILWQIAQTRYWELPHLHLGYWIENSVKMHYKSRFRPCEVLNKGSWHSLKHEGRCMKMQ